jgi:WS/DGAT/MGAT family acyltransferase
MINYLIALGCVIGLAIGQLLFSTPDKGNQFRGTIGTNKRATWSPALSLEQVKFVSKVFGCTINDVLLSAIAGALRKYLQPSVPDFASVALHTIVPVDMRRDSRIAQVQTLMGDIVDEPIGNRVGAALLSLPIDIADPVDRLAVIHQTMEALKASGEGLLTYWMISALGAVPGDIQSLAMDFWLTKSSAVMTNVAGPNRQLYLGNAAIDTMIGWVPQLGPVGLGVSIFSYNGKVWLGVATDQGMAPDPEKIVGFFLDELRTLGMQAVQLTRPL